MNNQNKLLGPGSCFECSPLQYSLPEFGSGFVQLLVLIRWLPEQSPLPQPLHSDQPDQPPIM